MELTTFDPTDHLKEPQDIIFYLEAALEGDDRVHIASALRDIGRALPGIIDGLEK